MDVLSASSRVALCLISSNFVSYSCFWVSLKAFEFVSWFADNGSSVASSLRSHPEPAFGLFGRILAPGFVFGIPQLSVLRFP
ncbi:hypothetical protein BC829DRAFT_60827 [Chytridium lagenaria]|nr:hypothetical protein BC829DRAFT_60827 [Chytridium lagenaria]